MNIRLWRKRFSKKKNKNKKSKRNKSENNRDTSKENKNNTENANDSSEKDENKIKAKGLGYYLLGTLDWLDHPDQYQYVDTEKIINDYFWENNYNQLILGIYDWKEKVVLDDAKKIIQKIRNNVFNDEKQLNYRKTKGRIVDLKILFYRDFIREYVSKDAQKGKKREFINSFIKDMKDP